MSERRVVLVHAGVCDSTMWDGFDLDGATRHELRGFGQTAMPPSGTFSHAEDLEAALDGKPAALVGASFGGFVCLHVAASQPHLVTELVLLDAPLFRHTWSDEIMSYQREEDGLLEQGDRRGAATLNADFWLTTPEPRDRVIEMQERIYELQEPSEAEDVTPEAVDLAAITARSLVVVGAFDKPDFHEIAEQLAREIPDARHAVIEAAGHLPSLEQPEETARLLREFLNG
jgi:3-oxoadipate enol-lactonase